MSSYLKLIKDLSAMMRTDVVALWREPGPEDKKGTYRPRKTPLTDDDLYAHLGGAQPIGLYVLPQDIGPLGLTRLAVVDLDDKKKMFTWPELCKQAALVDSALEQMGILTWPCRSGSGHGIHLWIRWKIPQESHIVKEALRQAVALSEVKVHVDIFPTADKLLEGDLGSLVALPLSRKSRPIDNLHTGTVIEEPESWLYTEPPYSVSVISTHGLDVDQLQSEAGRGNMTDVYGPTDPITVAEALRHISTNDYEMWRDMGMALKQGAESGQLEHAMAEKLWTDWASRDEKFSQRSQDYNWRRFRPNGTLTIATIFFKAKEAGWKAAPEPKKKVTPFQIVGGEPLWIKEADKVPKHTGKLNETHFFSLEGGKATVFREDWDSTLERRKLTRMHPTDFKLVYKNVNVVTGNTKKGAPTVEDLGSAWLADPYRRQYKEIVLKPEGAPHDVYNLWRGFTVEPSSDGSCEIFKEHVLKNICSGDQQAFDYLWRWCALTFQKPHKPIGTAVVLRGGRGTGKGTFARGFGELMGQHYMQIFSSRDVTGRFNSHLRDCILLFADEALWAGSKSEESTLKGLITEPYLSIEGKGRDLYQCRNMLHMIIATNNEWSIPAGLDERRFLALHVGDDHKQDNKFFNALWAQMETGGRERLLWEMLNLNLDDFEPNKVPQTKELATQKMLSLDPLQEWWYQKLAAGEALAATEWDEAISIQALYLDYLTYCKRAGVRAAKSLEYMSHKLRSILPAEPTKSRKRNAHEMVFEAGKIEAKTLITLWQLPELGYCRKFFDKQVKSDVKWEPEMGQIGIKLDLKDGEIPF